MIALSFLGRGKYEETVYSFNNQKVKTSYFPFAVSQFVKPDKLFVIMTGEAEKVHAAQLKKLCDYEPIRIPNGKSEKEFWVIFDKITEVIKEEEKIVFDITHGFRSQPFIVIVLLLYLKALKNIKIENILYGAFEAKDKNITPVFELKQFMDLVEWTNAVQEFIKNGNMKYLQVLLSEIHKNTYIKNMETKSNQLKNAGNDLAKLTDAFATIRLKEMFESANKFTKRIDGIKKDLESIYQAKPFANLFNVIVEKIEPISDAEKELFSKKGFEAQKPILNWYIETSKYQKAITLAREFVVSKFLLEIEKIDTEQLLSKDLRKDAENKLNEMAEMTKAEKELDEHPAKLADIWNELIDVRNDINHASMRNKPLPAKSLIKQVKKIINNVCEL